MSSSSAEGNTSRKAPLEDLSQEELVHKCRSLLQIAHKAKLAKDELLEQNASLQLKLENESETTQAIKDMLRKLTEQKSEMIIKLHNAEEKNKALLDEMKQYKAHHQEVQVCNAELENEKSSLNRQISRLTAENDQLLEQLDGLEKQIVKLSEEGAMLRDQCTVFEGKKQSDVSQGQEELLTSLRKQVESYETQLKAETVKCQNLCDELAQITKEKSAIESSILRADAENHRLNKSLDERDFVISSLQADIAKSSDLQSLQDDFDRLRESYSNLMLTNDGLNSELKSVKEEKIATEEKISGLEQICDQLKETNQALSGEMAKLHSTDKSELSLVQSKLQSLLKEHEELQSNASELTNRVVELEDQISDYQKIIHNFSAQNEALLQKIGVLEDENSSYKIALERHQNEKANFEEELKTVKNQFNDALKRCQEIEGEKEALKKEKDDSNSHWASELANCRKELESVLENSSKLENIIENVEKENLTFKVTLENWEKEIGNLEEEIKALKNQRNDLIKHRDELISSEETKKSKLEEKVAALEDRCSELEHQNTALANEKTHNEASSSELANCRKELATSLAKSSELENIIKNLEGEKASFEEDFKTLKEQNLDMLKHREELQREIFVLSSGKVETETKTCNLNAELLSVREELQSALKNCSDLERDNLAKMSEIETLKKELSSMVKNVSGLEELQMENEEAKIEINTLKTELGASIQTASFLEGCQDENKTLKLEIGSLKTEMDGYKVEKATLKHRITALKSQLESFTIREESLQEQSNTPAVKNETCPVPLKNSEELEAEVVSLKNELKQLSNVQAANDRLLTELSDQKKALSDLKANHTEIFFQAAEKQDYITFLDFLAVKFEQSSRLVELINRFKAELNHLKSYQDQYEKLAEERRLESENHSAEVKSLQDALNEALGSTETAKLRGELSSTEELLRAKSKELKEAKESKDLLAGLLHTKYSAVISDLRQLKQQHAGLVSLAKEHWHQVKIWQDKIRLFSARYEEEISKLLTDNAETLELLRAKASTSDTEKAFLLKEKSELYEKITALKKQVDSLKNCNFDMTEELSRSQEKSAELLRELNDMNEALKKRGEIISQEQAFNQKLTEKLRGYEEGNGLKTAAGQAENRDSKEAKPEASPTDNEPSPEHCDARSTSTVSRSEDAMRFKELDGSWEERYSKLRSLALKFKAKIKEQSVDLEASQRTRSELEARLAQAERTSAEEVKLLKSDLEALSRSKDDKQWKAKLAERDSNAIIVKELEGKIAKLEADLASKEALLRAETEAHKDTKEKLSEANRECKKKSVLSLEMEEYEKLHKELSGKLERKKEIISDLENTIDSQKETMRKLSEEFRAQKELGKSDADEIRCLKTEIARLGVLVGEKELLINEKDSRVQELLKTFEEHKLAHEELSSELTRIVADNQRTVDTLRAERTNLHGQVLGFQDKVASLTSSLKEKETALSTLQKEFSGYKVRAQSVLKQNMNKDINAEERLNEENAELRAQLDVCNAEIKELSAAVGRLKESNELLGREKEQSQVRCKDLEAAMAALQSAQKAALEEIKKQISEHSETIRSQKIHTDTLVQCYKQQLADAEEKHCRELADLKEQLDRSAPGVAQSEEKLDVLCMEREEGEGSESVQSGPLLGLRSKQQTSLEYLLSHDEADVAVLKQELGQQTAKVNHLTALLADAEQDLAKHSQMNQLLKEEIRRQQRSEEREKHAENLEYLKNIVFKFLTLNNSDEKLRLVPVLNTILKLSPEETQKMNEAAAREDSAIKKLGNYLPLWPSRQN